MEPKEPTEMSGTNGDNPRIPVLRSPSSDSTSLDAVRLKSLAAAPPPPPAEQSDWQRYLSSIMRHKWFVLTVTLVGTVLGIIGSRFLDPRYTAKAILWVDVAPVNRNQSADQPDQLLGERGWMELVTSNTVLDTVVVQRRLFIHTDTREDSAALASFSVAERVVPGAYKLVVDKAGRAFRLEMEDGTVVQRGRVGQPVGDNIGFLWTPTAQVLKPGMTYAFKVSAIPDASAALAQDVKSRLDPAGNFLRLQLKASSAAGAAATLNAIANRIVAVESEMKRSKFSALAGVMSDQWNQAKQTMEQADNALRDFRQRNWDRPLITQTPNGSLAVEGSGTATQLREDNNQRQRDRQFLEQLATRAQTGSVSIVMWNSIPAVQNSEYMKAALADLAAKQDSLRNARLRYTDSAAPVRQLSADLAVLEHQQIPSLARMLARDLGEVVAVSKPRVDTALGQLRAAPNYAMEEDRLVREQRLAADQFATVDREYGTAKLGVVSSLPDVRILDPATEPLRPASDYGLLLILLAMMLSFGFAAVFVNVRDKMDPKVRYPEQITGQMRLPILGAVPHVSWRLGANGDGPAQVIEALRGLRLRVLHAHAGGPLTLTITSPGIGDGKSFVSLNLALSFADAGYRTLLVDGDTRRGVQHKALKTPSTPGLTDVVAARVPLDAALRQTSYPGLTFLSSGTRMQRAPERLLSQNMRDLMAKLRSMYDVVIVDSPPLGAGADPLVLGTLTENLLIVMRTGQSDINLAATKLEVLNALPVRVIGAVLNDVRSSGVYRYYMYSSAEYELVDDEGPTREALPSILGGRS